MEGGNPAIRTLLFLVLLMINGVFSGNEAAYGELNESRVQKKAEEGNKKAARVLKILQAPGNFRNAAALVVTSVAMIAGAFIVHLFYTMARDAVWAGFSQVDPKLTAASYRNCDYGGFDFRYFDFRNHCSQENRCEIQ